MEHVIKSATVPYTAAQLYALVNDIKKYPEFLPWCDASEIKEEKEGEIIASMTLSKGGICRTFITRNTLSLNSRIEMELVDGPLKHLDGVWKFTENDNHECEVQVDITYALHKSLISIIIIGPLFRHITNKLLDAFVQRAHEVYGIPEMKTPG